MENKTNMKIKRCCYTCGNHQDFALCNNRGGKHFDEFTDNDFYCDDYEWDEYLTGYEEVE